MNETIKPLTNDEKNQPIDESTIITKFSSGPLPLAGDPIWLTFMRSYIIDKSPITIKIKEILKERGFDISIISLNCFNRFTCFRNDEWFRLVLKCNDDIMYEVNSVDIYPESQPIDESTIITKFSSGPLPLAGDPIWGELLSYPVDDNSLEAKATKILKDRGFEINVSGKAYPDTRTLIIKVECNGNVMSYGVVKL